MKTTKQIELNEMESSLRNMAFVGEAMNESKGITRPSYLLNTFEIKRKLPNFAEFIDENYLKDLSQKFGGPIIFIGGTTEFDVPPFMRAKRYFMTEEEILLRFMNPTEFKTYEIFIDSDKIEARALYKQKQGNNYVCYEHYFRADGVEEITRKPINDLLEQII